MREGNEGAKERGSESNIREGSRSIGTLDWSNRGEGEVNTRIKKSS